VRATKCKWWKLFLWQLASLVEGFLCMLDEGFGITFAFLCMSMLYGS
jgi:hypothetical protein